MTAFVVGARSGDPERARFIRALLASLLLHGVLFVLKVGPVSGVHAPSLPGGGTIEAVLRRAPAPAAVPEQPVDATLQPALAAVTADAHTQPNPRLPDLPPLLRPRRQRRHQGIAKKGRMPTRVPPSAAANPKPFRCCRRYPQTPAKFRAAPRCWPR
jgi:hypothetical protein